MILELAIRAGIVFNECMNLAEDNSTGLWISALLLSLLLHTIGAVLVLNLESPRQTNKKRGDLETRLFKIVREEKDKKEHSPLAQEKQEDKLRPFTKTSAETPEQRPKEPDYIGSRDTTISGDENPAKEKSDADAPSAEGIERDEVNTVNQKNQDGDLEFDGLKTNKAQPTPPATLVSPDAPVQESTPPPPSPAVKPQEEPSEADAQEKKDTTAQALPEEQRAEAKPTKTIHPLEVSSTGDILLEQLNLAEEKIPEIAQLMEDVPPPAPDLPATKANTPQASAKQQTYDPMFTPEAQPGFRTNEKRSRSTGRFIVGRNASLNVAATPLGRYQELIYRRIAYYWYAMVEDKRGDILPGSLTIRILVNHRGQVTSMELISRSGASVSQQSITFSAIRKASIPAMPLDVQESIVGDKLDLVFTFYFD